jgi:hypothetical protein
MCVLSQSVVCKGKSDILATSVQAWQSFIYKIGL